MKFLLVILLFAFVPSKQIVMTIAGYRGGINNCTNCPATSNTLSQPNQVTADRFGNIYVAETGNNVVKKIDRNGIITLVAGNYQNGYRGDGGVAVSASLSRPADVAFDKSGSMYIVEAANRCVRKINSLGIIYTYAGRQQTGSSGDGGPAINASMKWPLAIAFDKQGNLLIVDNMANCVRKVWTTGIISTIAGSGRVGYSGDGGPATNATLNGPTDIAVDSKNNIYIADNGNNVIRKIDPSGGISTFAGTGVEGYGEDGVIATNCGMRHPYGVFVDKRDIVYFSDNGNSTVRKIDTKRKVTTLVGRVGKAGYSGDGGSPLECEINNPGGLILDDKNNIILADFGNNVIRKIGRKGQ